MNSIEDRIKLFKKELPTGVTLVAVSKTHPSETIIEAYNSGHRIFGENKVQELISKFELLPKDIEWHFIGHLQTNKIKYIAGFVKLIHSVDSLKLLQTIDSEAKKNNRKIDCLLQIKVAEEDSKFGISSIDVDLLLKDYKLGSFQNIQIRGVMGMATFTSDTDQIRQEFKKLKSLFTSLKMNHFAQDEKFSEISMGMSDDYPIAIEEGSTMIRVGSKIFGIRSYQNKTE